METLRTEFATWDLNQQGWQLVGPFSLVSFRLDGKISASDTHNPDGSIAHWRCLYDHAGRLSERNSWMDDGPISKTLYFYDEAGRHLRTLQLSQGGTQAELELCSYDANGRKTRVQYLFPHEADLQCGTGNACGASTGYAIEGTASCYGAPGARTMTVTYDEQNLPGEVVFHDENHRLVNQVIFRRDNEGRLLSEEAHGSEGSPFGAMLDRLRPEGREEMAAMLQQVLGETLSSTTYAYDPQRRLVKWEYRMGRLGGDSTTYRYDAGNNPIEEMVEHRSREASFDEVGNLQYSPDRVNVQHNRLEYRYDAHRNWTERIVSIRAESESEFQLSNIERRTITYHDA